MVPMNNKLTVQINGMKYAIITNEDVDYVQGLAKEMDVLVSDLMKNTRMSFDQAMLLAGLHFLDLYKKADQGADNLRAQVTEYAEDAAKARMELSEARKQLGKGKKNG